MHTVTLEKAKEDLAKLIDETVAGGEVIITQGAQPVARLIPAVSRDEENAHAALLGCWIGKVRLEPDWDEPLKDLAPYME